MNARGGSRQRTALHYASLNNHVAVATTLLEAGANEFSRDSGGYTPLNLCMGGDMCKLLHKVSVQYSRDCHMICLCDCHMICLCDCHMICLCDCHMICLCDCHDLSV